MAKSKTDWYNTLLADANISDDFMSWESSPTPAQAFAPPLALGKKRPLEAPPARLSSATPKKVQKTKFLSNPSSSMTPLRAPPQSASTGRSPSPAAPPKATALNKSEFRLASDYLPNKLQADDDIHPRWTGNPVHTPQSVPTRPSQATQSWKKHPGSSVTLQRDRFRGLEASLPPRPSPMHTKFVPPKVKKPKQPTLVVPTAPERSMPKISPMLEKPKALPIVPGMIPVTDVPANLQSVFSSFTHFNKLQSSIFETLIGSDDNIVVTAPTGAGKTVVFELAICRALQTRKSGDKVLYLGPLKALCKERASDWGERFGRVGVTCTELTSDTSDDLSWGDKDILVATPEKWDSLTRHKSDLIHKISLVMIDEVQNLGEGRGPALEAVVSRMKVLRASKPMRLVAVSATCPNAVDIGRWLDTREENVKVFGEEYRPVQLEKHVLGYPCKNDNHFLFMRSLKFRLYEVVLRFYDQRPSLVFCSSRKDASQAAQQLVTEVAGRVTNPFILSQEQRQRLQIVSQEFGDVSLQQAVASGVGYYHAGLSVRDRDIMQRLYTSGCLLVLCSTSCFSQGVNLPARLVVILGTEMYRSGGYEQSSIVDILQMIGRAGRPQFDTHGVAVVMTHESTQERYRNLVSGMEDIESSLLDSLPTHLNSEIVLGTIRNMAQAVDWLKSTFLFVRLLGNPSHYGFPQGVADEKLRESLRQLCLAGVRELDTYQMIDVDPQGSTIHSCEQGRIMAHCCINFDTMKAMSELQEDSTILNVLTTLARSKELSSVTLRRSEKTTLNALHAQVRYPLLEASKSSKRKRKPKLKRIQTNEQKIVVLLQAVLGGLEVKEPSLRQEGQHAVTGLGRVLSGVVLSLIDRKLAGPLTCAILLHQSVAQKMWYDSDLVGRQLDGIGAKLGGILQTSGLTTLKSIDECPTYRIESLLNRRPPFGSKVKASLERVWPKFAIAAHVQRRSAGATVRLEVTAGNPLKKAARSKFRKGMFSALVVTAEEGGTLLLADARISNSRKVTEKTINVPAGVSAISVRLYSLDGIGMNVEEEVHVNRATGPAPIQRRLSPVSRQEARALATFTPSSDSELEAEQDAFLDAILADAQAATPAKRLASPKEKAPVSRATAHPPQRTSSWASNEAAATNASPYFAQNTRTKKVRAPAVAPPKPAVAPSKAAAALVAQDSEAAILAQIAALQSQLQARRAREHGSVAGAAVGPGAPPPLSPTPAPVPNPPAPAEDTLKKRPNTSSSWWKRARAAATTGARP